MVIARLLAIAVIGGITASCASGDSIATTSASEQIAQKAVRPGGAEVYEVLVQYRDTVKEQDKIAVRRSINAQLKERLDSPSGAQGLELLLVPKTSMLDTVEKVVSSLRQHKVVRFAEPQQIYKPQD